jgi:TP901 family phage tail tape measure protein
MALGARELMLVLRARDEASRILRGAAGNIDHMSDASQKAAQKHMQQGQSLVGIGVGIAAAGAAGLKWLNDSTTAAQSYNQEAALTLTQTDDLGTSLAEVKSIGLELAKTIPVPFEQIQEGLYDIFSSMDVSVPQAKMLLTEFSRAAVAGQTDLQTAGRGTIAILNAWKLPATDVNRVNDVMFKLVQKGVGTYDQFSKSIGRAIPSTVRAGGSIEDLAGMMAFMTRNGLSTAQAATSAGRAFDAMSNPATEKHMKEIGLSVRNAKGEFKPMTQVIEEMNGKLGKMSAPDRAKAMKELFLGSGGTIQARRFFDLAVPGFKELNSLTGEVSNSSGAMNEAYDIMFKQPQSQVQLMTNKYQAMRVEIGDQLLPIKMKLVEWAMKVLDAWNKLSPGTQKTIIIIAAVTAVLTVLVGVLTIVVGGILMLMGAAALAGLSLAGIIITVGLVIAIIAALAALAIIFYKKWDDILAAFKGDWNKLKTFLEKALLVMAAYLITWILNTIDGVTGMMRKIKVGFIRDWNAVIAFFRRVPGMAMSAVRSLGGMMTGFFNSVGVKARQAVVSKFNAMIAFFKTIPGKIKGAFGNPGGILSAIGRQIVQGLINGVRGMIGSLRDQFSQITGMIPDWKGPEAVDKKLLYNAGRLTMQGYGEGLDEMLPGIRAKLRGFTTEVPRLVNPIARPVVLGNSAVARGANQDAGVTQSFVINTREIDPRKHAADLGVMLAQRLG